MEKRKISGFKKFSELKGDENLEEVRPEMEAQPDTDSTRPMNPNLPNKGEKVERMISRKNIISKDQNLELENVPVSGDETNEKVEFYGKIAKFPKKTKASKSLNFLENVKISKNSIWYIMIEKQEDELQMVKYNNKKGVDLGKFVNELKSYYITKFSDNKKTSKLIENITILGANEFSSIKNIPNIEIDGKKMISKITEDLIKLLSK